MNGIKLRGTGRCVPANTVTNDDLSRLVDTNDEWITARTGIRSRYRCEKETLTELCVSAARDALHMAGITPADIGVCIVATVSADTVVPSAACGAGPDSLRHHPRGLHHSVAGLCAAA